jgi:ferrochelatase
MIQQVIIADYGGPENESEVKDFLFQMFKDKRILSLPFFLRYPLAFFISSLRWKKSAANYKLIGFSPVKKNIQELCNKLNKIQTAINFTYGFRYTSPFLKDKIREADLKNAIIFPVFPHYSFSTYETIKDVCNKENKIVKPYYNNSSFIMILKNLIDKQLAQANGKTGILLTAHSIPQRFEKKGDVYVSQVYEQKKLISRLFPDHPLSLGFQSPIGPIKWVGPFLKDAVNYLTNKNCESIIIVPLSFTTDNSETLFDLDIELKKIIKEENGLNYFRIPCLNDRDEFCSFILDYIKGDL